MRRLSTLLLVPAALVGGSIVAPHLAGNAAQDATPAADPLAGVTIEARGGGLPAAAPGQALSLLRVTFAPGTRVPPHTQPGALVVAVESGTFGFTVTQGQAQVTRAAVPGGTPAVAEPLAPGTEVLLGPGDAVYHDADTGHTGRNAGDGPLVLTIATLFDPSQPAFIFTDGTPTP